MHITASFLHNRHSILLFALRIGYFAESLAYMLSMVTTAFIFFVIIYYEFFYGWFIDMRIYLMYQVMEIPLLKSLLNSITSVFKLSSCESIKCEPVQEYHQTIEDMLKLLKPILDAILDVEIPSDELLQKEFTGLCQSIDDLRETFENWQLLMSKVYFVCDMSYMMIFVIHSSFSCSLIVEVITLKLKGWLFHFLMF